MADALVRSAQLPDLEAIVELSHALVQEDSGTRQPHTNTDWALQEGTGYFSKHIAADDSFTLVAEVDGKITGYLVGYLRQPYSLRPVRMAVLESMFVTQRVRGRGIGQQLVDAFLLWSQERNSRRVSVTAFASK